MEQPKPCGDNPDCYCAAAVRSVFWYPWWNISRGCKISVKANWHLSAVPARLSMRWLTAALVCGPVKLGDGQVGEQRVIPTPLHVFVRGLLLLVTEAVLWLLHTGPVHAGMTGTAIKQCTGTAHCGQPSSDGFVSAGYCSCMSSQKTGTFFSFVLFGLLVINITPFPFYIIITLSLLGRDCTDWAQF